MLGCDDAAVAERVIPAVKSFAAKVVPCGPCGAGHAVKAVNNSLNVAHLLLGTEALLALQKAGVDPEVALEAINGSSGRSLQTEQRIPQEVLSGRFGYGFKLDLMAKDCGIAKGVLQQAGSPDTSLLMTAVELFQRAKAENADPDADYTRAVQMLERSAGATLRSKCSAQDPVLGELEEPKSASVTCNGHSAVFGEGEVSKSAPVVGIS
jgi:3-hydroxyisobutyrate dehydrogenase